MTDGQTPTTICRPCMTADSVEALHRIVASLAPWTIHRPSAGRSKVYVGPDDAREAMRERIARLRAELAA